MNFNRKDRWKQREIDDIVKNFDIKNAKFKDYGKISRELNFHSSKEFSSVDEVYYYLDQIYKEGIFETQISKALDIFLKEVNRFKEEDLRNNNFAKFIRELSSNIISFEYDINLLKTAKFLDWFNIKDQYIWYNLQRAIMNRHNTLNPEILVKVLEHFANQKEGSYEFYDLYQYLFWSEKFRKSSNEILISLSYSMFISEQGYEIFYYDFSQFIINRLNDKDETLDLIKLVQSYSERGESYLDIFNKVEELLVKRVEELTAEDSAAVACAYSIAGAGSQELFNALEESLFATETISPSIIRDIVRGIQFI